MNHQIQKQVEETEYPQETQITYPYSVRLEQTAKGCRVSVHVYNRSLELAVRESIEAYLKTRKTLKDANLKVAPEE